jgi:hypothetical protein
VAATGQPVAQINCDTLGKNDVLGFMGLLMICQFLMGLPIASASHTGRASKWIAFFAVDFLSIGFVSVQYMIHSSKHSIIVFPLYQLLATFLDGSASPAREYLVL